VLNPLFIKATDLQDAWFQSVYNILEHGREFVIDKGSFAGQKRLEFDYMTIHITHPWTLPLLPKLNPMLGLPDPVAEGYLDDYLPYLMTGEEKPGEAYTYGQRICAVNMTDFLIGTEVLATVKEKFLIPEVEYYDDFPSKGVFKTVVYPSVAEAVFNQMELMIWAYKNKGYRNNQMILQVGQPSDMLLIDPPCLRHIDTRIQDGKLHFFPYFRSWDLYGGFPANLAAIEMMRQYCATEIGLDSIEGEIIASSKGCHIYDYCVKLTEIIRGKTIEEFKQEISAG
jgi:thymidylate synthase